MLIERKKTNEEKDDIVRVNPDTDRLTAEERKNRPYFHSLEPTMYVPSDGILPIYCTPKIKFKQRKTSWDARGAIDGFFSEEDQRRQFFYPFLPCNFMDIGVAHGSWTLPALAAGCNVVGFEIDPRFHLTLRESLLINPEFRGILNLFSVGLYDAHGKGDLFELENITFTPLDMFMKHLQFAPSYIKIDVEGLEYKVLNGAKKTLDLLHPKLFIEIHYSAKADQEEIDGSNNSIFDFLKNYDYKHKEGRVEKAYSYHFFY